MLLEIYINNFVLIDEMRLEFGPGLNILTGETGAGKSIIIDALSLIMGGRMKADSVRDASRKAVAEAVFNLNPEAYSFLLKNELIEEEDNTVIVSREILPSGRSSARINGRNVPLGVLKDLSLSLLDMHLQNDHQNIFRPEKYIDYVDSFASGIDAYLPQIEEAFAEWQEKKKFLQELKTNERKRSQRLEFLNYQISEIENARLVEGEEDDLRNRRENIQNAGKLLEGSAKVLQLLYEGEESRSAYDLVAEALDIARGLEKYNTFAALIEPLQQLNLNLQEMASTLSSFRDSLDFEPGCLDQVEERLLEIKRLKSKYGDDISRILAFRDKAREELDSLNVSTEKQAELEQEIKLLQDRYMKAAQVLTGLRRQAGHKLEERVHHELLQLDMSRVRFEVAIDPTSQPGPQGVDQVNFLFSSNPGEKLLPVAQIASGGEISRFALALKTALAEVYHIDTLIFDEIDVGLGGNALNTVARKLGEIARHHQVIAVTHSPQVASYADSHFRIEKIIKNNRTFTVVTCLDQEGRARELARMLGGEKYTPITMQHAREMLTEAHQNKISPERLH